MGEPLQLDMPFSPYFPGSKTAVQSQLKMEQRTRCSRRFSSKLIGEFGSAGQHQKTALAKISATFDKPISPFKNDRKLNLSLQIYLQVIAGNIANESRWKINTLSGRYFAALAFFDFFRRHLPVVPRQTFPRFVRRSPLPILKPP
jgi:hypothetical protein